MGKTITDTIFVLVSLSGIVYVALLAELSINEDSLSAHLALVNLPSFMYFRKAEDDHLPTAWMSASSKPACPIIVVIPALKLWQMIEP